MGFCRVDELQFTLFLSLAFRLAVALNRYKQENESKAG